VRPCSGGGPFGYVSRSLVTFVNPCSPGR